VSYDPVPEAREQVRGRSNRKQSHEPAVGLRARFRMKLTLNPHPPQKHPERKQGALVNQNAKGCATQELLIALRVLHPPSFPQKVSAPFALLGQRYCDGVGFGAILFRLLVQELPHWPLAAHHRDRVFTGLRDFVKFREHQIVVERFAGL
jgi:hypothetical protein